MTLNCHGTLVDLSTPIVMGVVNITPDSFYDKSRVHDDKALGLKIEKMLRHEAKIIDIGAYSSRPQAEDISLEEEKNRLLPSVEFILKHFPEALLSIDTFRAKIASECIAMGAHIINDISGGLLDEEMMLVLGNKGVPYILMHMLGTPQTMQQYTQYNDLVTDIVYSLSVQKQKAIKAGIKDVIVDPGFGFSKNVPQNFQLLNHLDRLQIIGSPILAGLSRKSMIYKTLDIHPEHALNGTTALNMIALERGAKILRVHDVKAAKECIDLHLALHHTE